MTDSLDLMATKGGEALLSMVFHAAWEADEAYTLKPDLEVSKGLAAVVLQGAGVPELKAKLLKVREIIHDAQTIGVIDLAARTLLDTMLDEAGI